MKPVLVSGIQPTGRLHIGNYLGALKNFVELQNSGTYECYFFIADLHALTENPDPAELNKNIVNLAADFLAAGLDPKKSTIYRHSEIPAHSELAWILNTIAPLGELDRMTQFKEKASIRTVSSFLITNKKTGESHVENIANNPTNVGLFDYPVLMAADILLYSANFVPVGNDQDQHLELTRTLARKFNAKFGKTFVEPKGLHTGAPRVMSLKHPEKKMSKSDPVGCLFIDDSPEEIRAKIARATTDSDTKIAYDPEKKPGLSNLIDIAVALRSENSEAVVAKFHSKSYAEFKSALATLVADHFAGFREKKKKLLATRYSLISVLNAGSERAAEVANKKITDAKKKIGITL